MQEQKHTVMQMESSKDMITTHKLAKHPHKTRMCDDYAQSSAVRDWDTSTNMNTPASTHPRGDRADTNTNNNTAAVPEAEAELHGEEEHGKHGDVPSATLPGRFCRECLSHDSVKLL